MARRHCGRRRAVERRARPPPTAYQSAACSPDLEKRRTCGSSRRRVQVARGRPVEREVDARDARGPAARPRGGRAASASRRDPGGAGTAGKIGATMPPCASRWSRTPHRAPADARTDVAELLREAGAEVDASRSTSTTVCDGAATRSRGWRRSARPDRRRRRRRLARARRRCSRCAPACRSRSCPTGTANSFARWLGLPLDLEEAARLAARPRRASRRPSRSPRRRAPVRQRRRDRPLRPRRPRRAAAEVDARPARLRGRRRRAPASTGQPLTTAVQRRRRRGVVAARRGRSLVAATGAFGGDSSDRRRRPARRQARRRDRRGRAARRARRAARCAMRRGRARARGRRRARPRPRRRARPAAAAPSSTSTARSSTLDARALRASSARVDVGGVVMRPRARRAGRVGDRRRRWAPGTPATRCATGASTATRLRAARRRGARRRLRASSCAPPRRSPARRSRPATTSSCSSTATRSSRPSSRRSRGAEHTINLVTYVYWRGDIVARGRRTRWPQGARGGVEVNVLLDAIGHGEDGARARPRRCARPASASRASARPSPTRCGG